jgi:uncharacterized protein (DUF1501 family)
MNRRTFIKNAGILAFSPYLLSSLQACSKRDKKKVLVIIQLVGGNDGLNTLVPVDQYSVLSQVRKNILIDENKLLGLKDTSVTKLHPSLSGVRDMYNNDLIKFIQSVGYENPVYSHFRSTDIYLSGSASNEFLNTGWMARYLSILKENDSKIFFQNDVPYPPAVKIGDSGSLLFMNEQMDMSVMLDSIDRFDYLNLPSDIKFDQSEYADKLNYIRDVLLRTKSFGPSLEKVLQQDSVHSKLYPPKGENMLADKMKIISKLIKSDLQTPVYMVEFKGFDTHQDQVDSHNAAKGSHAHLLSQLSEAVTCFWDDVVKMGMEENVIGVTISEFGRRIYSNGSFGSDHGAAQPVIVFGKNIKTGIEGLNPQISSDITVDDNLEAAIDFRNVYASLLKQWFGVEEAVVKKVFKKEEIKFIPIA